MKNETAQDRLRARNEQIFKNLKECKPRNLGITIQAFELTSYNETPNTSKFLNARGWIDVVTMDEEGKPTNKTVRHTASWDSEGKCIQPVFSGPNGTSRSYPDADLVVTVQP
jgi:hypothetical protein